MRSCPILATFFCRKGGKPRLSTLQAFLFFAALIALTACKPVGPNYNRPGFEAPATYKETGASTAIVPPPNPAGGGWQKANPSDGMLRGKWWEIYQDPQLNQLEESPNGQPNNQALRQAVETYLAARDQIKVARSALYPTLSAGPSASRNQVSTNQPLFNKTANPTYSDYEITGQASWEPDFFGRIRRTIEAARENAAGQRRADGRRGPQPSRRNGVRLLPAPRPRF